MIKKIITNKKQLAIPSEEITDHKLSHEIIRDLKDTALYHAKSKVGCAGLAANQIGYLHRIVLIRTAIQHLIMINPVITKVDGCKSSLVGEGCLSRPGVHRKIRRDKRVIVSYITENGEQIEELFKNFEARVIQHECQHLDGIFI